MLCGWSFGEEQQQLVIKLHLSFGLEQPAQLKPIGAAAYCTTMLLTHLPAPRQHLVCPVAVRHTLCFAGGGERCVFCLCLFVFGVCVFGVVFGVV